jgi:CRISPR-associated protein Cmr4
MYHKAFGIVETLAPLHVGASAGEETGNLNLIFRDQFTQTGIVPGSSVRGRFRADMRKSASDAAQRWYGHEAIAGQTDGGTTEAIVKFEYASLVWLPVFCPGQPVVWVTCPWLLKRYQQIAKGVNVKVPDKLPEPYSAPQGLGRQIEKQPTRTLFFNLGFIELKHTVDLAGWVPVGANIDPKYLVVVDNNDMAMIHDMALYRQSRVKLLDDVKKVDTDKGAFFNVEALPEGAVMVFPIALREKGWKPFAGGENKSELYFGGLESIGFGRCRVTLQMGV